MKIFGEGSLTASLNAQIDLARNEVRSEEKARLLGVDEAEYLDYLEGKFRVENSVIDWDGISVSEREEMINARYFPPMFNVYEGKSYPKQIVTYHIPFSGDGGLLQLRPSSGIAWTINVTISGGEILFDIVNWRDDPEEIRQEAQSTIDHIRRLAESVQAQTEQWNTRLRSELEQIVGQRKAEMQKQNALIEQLGVPIKRSENVPDTFAVPVRKKKPIIRKPQPSREVPNPEPVLDTSIYDAILAICEDMGREMERHPAVYYGKDEETLRDHFIMQLSPHFQSVSGETFNKQGKTDILIRHEGGNVFVAECKYWTGSKAFGEAIDQLLSYLTSRELKSGTSALRPQQGLHRGFRKSETGGP